MAGQAASFVKQNSPSNIVIAHAVGAVVFLRIASSIAWLDSAFVGKDAKFAPSFLSGAGLVHVVMQRFVHAALSPAIADALRNIVVPHAAVFAWLIALADLASGVSLLLGLFTRVGALISIGRAIVNILVSGGAGPDTIGFNSMLIVAGIIFIMTAAGRQYGVDRAILSRWPTARWLRIVA